jgi:hypothetical protein
LPWWFALALADDHVVWAHSAALLTNHFCASKNTKRVLVIVFLLYHREYGRETGHRKAQGCWLDAGSGAWKSPIMVKTGVAVPVPVHGRQDISAGLLAAIARQSGVRLK